VCDYSTSMIAAAFVYRVLQKSTPDNSLPENLTHEEHEMRTAEYGLDEAGSYRLRGYTTG